MAEYVLLPRNVDGLAKATGEALSEFQPGSGDPGIRGTPSSGSRLIS